MDPHRLSSFRGHIAYAPLQTIYLQNDKSSISKGGSNKMSINMKTVKDSQILPDSSSEWLTSPPMLILEVSLIH